MGIGKAKATGRKLVDVRRTYAVGSVTTQVTVAQIVGHNQHHIGPLSVGTTLGSSLTRNQQRRPHSATQ